MKTPLLTLLLIGLAVVGSLLVRQGYDAEPPIAFDAELWAEPPTESDLSRRYHMVDDLLRRYDLTEMDSTEVVALLSQPGYQTYGEREMGYWLRDEYGFSMAPDPKRSDVLVIRLDPSENVENVSVQCFGQDCQ